MEPVCVPATLPCSLGFWASAPFSICLCSAQVVQPLMSMSVQTPSSERRDGVPLVWVEERSCHRSVSTRDPWSGCVLVHAGGDAHPGHGGSLWSVG